MPVYQSAEEGTCEKTLMQRLNETGGMISDCEKMVDKIYETFYENQSESRGKDEVENVEYVLGEIESKTKSLQVELIRIINYLNGGKAWI